MRLLVLGAGRQDRDLVVQRALADQLTCDDLCGRRGGW
jgi:hypothetical protein